LVSYYEFKLYTAHIWPVHEITNHTSSFILTLYSHPKGDEYEHLYDKWPKCKYMHGRIQVLK